MLLIKIYTPYKKSFMDCNFYFSGSFAFGKHIPRVATSTRERVQTHANPKSRLQGAVRSKLLISSKNSKNYGSQQLYSGKIALMQYIWCKTFTEIILQYNLWILAWYFPSFVFLGAVTKLPLARSKSVSTEQLNKLDLKVQLSYLHSRHLIFD